MWQFLNPNSDLSVIKLKNNLSALNVCDFVEESISEILQSGTMPNDQDKDVRQVIWSFS